MKLLRALLTLTTVSLLLCACGQKGPLYLPDSLPEPVSPAQPGEPQSP
jgi:predicted small lipoprotein YifL